MNGNLSTPPIEFAICSNSLMCCTINNTHRELTTSYNYYQILDVFLFPILFGSEPNVQMGKGEIFYLVKFMKES